MEGLAFQKPERKSKKGTKDEKKGNSTSLQVWRRDLRAVTPHWLQFFMFLQGFFLLFLFGC